MPLSKFEVLEIIGDLCAAFPNFKVENMAALVERYHRFLGKYSPSAIRRGSRLAILNCKFFPSVAELVEFSRQAVLVLGENHPLWSLDDAGQRFQDEMFDVAPRLMTKDTPMTPAEKAEFIRLTLSN
jgi:hypothetical protein